MLENIPKEMNPAATASPQRPRTADMRIADTAVFKNGKMVGWLNEQESRGLLWVKNRVDGGIITFEEDGQLISLEIINAGSQVKSEVQEGSIQINIKIRVESNIGESQAKLDFSKPEVIKLIEYLQGEEVKREVFMALDKARQYNSDIFGFGRIIHARNPGLWREIKGDWYSYYPDLAVNVEVDSKISRIGLINKPAEKVKGEDDK
ncbi:hypothetical protein N752_08200 [Desulforamulus aquiferis]|nr:Ger(x)C family spore germination C-terminal domain-containing protein [Desulforamulus aquiferis]RYD05866.1 hypothetical protein N752_08200 [Desulforamulus aquiferis]